MSDIGPEVQILPDQTSTQSKEDVLLPNTWEQVRAMQLSTPYSETLEAFFRRSQEWRNEPRQRISEQDWRLAIAKQVQAANDMVQNYHNPDVKMKKSGKIFAQGIARPEIGQQVLTRLYVGVDPRKAADAFRVLIDEFSKAGCMRDIDVAFNEEEVKDGKIMDNMIVIYEPQSRPDVLNKILSAYRSAKSEHPDIFNLTPAQREAVIRNALTRYKAVVDANLSFVEMDPEDAGGSWDTMHISDVNDAFNINRSLYKSQGRQLTDQEWLGKIRAKEKHGFVWTRETQKTLKQEAQEPGQIKTGDQMHYKRKLSASALIQRGTIIAK